VGGDTVIHKSAYIQPCAVEVSAFHFLFNIFVIIMPIKAFNFSSYLHIRIEAANAQGN
jgi:hypothetical protein